MFFAPSSPWLRLCSCSLSLINADFCVAGSLIAYGALLGKVSPVQLMVLTLFGVTLFAVEEYIILDLLHVSLATLACPSTPEKLLCDSVLSLVLTVQRRRWLHGHSCLWGILWSGHFLGPLPAQLTPKQTPERIRLPLRRLRHDRCEPRTSSFIVPTIYAFLPRPTGTLFLWMFWPSFNSAITDHGDGQHRAAINTYLGLASCVLTTVAISSMHDKRGRLDMVTVR